MWWKNNGKLAAPMWGHYHVHSVSSSLFLSFFFAPTFALPWLSFLPSQVYYKYIYMYLCETWIDMKECIVMSKKIVCQCWLSISSLDYLDLYISYSPVSRFFSAEVNPGDVLGAPSQHFHWWNPCLGNPRTGHLQGGFDLVSHQLTMEVVVNPTPLLGGL